MKLTTLFTDAGAAASDNELGAKSRSALLLAAVLGLLGAALLMLYLHRFEEEISGGRRVPLLTLLKPVARGELVTADALTTVEVPVAYVEQRAVREADRSKVVGVRTAHALAAQDTLLWSDLALSTENRDLSSLIAPGKRAVTIRASETGGDSNGLVRPGDYVDVIVTLHEERGGQQSAAILLLQRVLVLAVGAETQPQAFVDAPTRTPGSAVREKQLTLSMRVEEAQLLSLARTRGALSVAVRGPNDSKVIEGVPDLPMSSLYDKVARETVQKRRELNVPVRVGDKP